MKIGVISDTHGSFENQQKAAEWLAEFEKASVIAHLGDDSSDAEEIRGCHADVVAVPGVFEDVYADERKPNRFIKEFSGVRVLLTHTEVSHQYDLPSDPAPEDVICGGAADVVLCGHSHFPKIERKGGVFVVNPGHLKPSDRKGAPASFAVLDTRLRNIRIIALADMSVFIRGDF